MPRTQKKDTRIGRKKGLTTRMRLGPKEGGKKRCKEHFLFGSPTKKVVAKKDQSLWKTVQGTEEVWGSGAPRNI